MTPEDLAALPPQEITLDSVSALGTEVVAIDTSLAELARQSKNLSAAKNSITHQQLPEMMSQAGLQDYTMASGKKVQMKKIYQAKIKEEHSTAAYGWLRNNSAMDIVKKQISIEFSPTDHENIDRAVALLQENNIPFSITQGVHPSTLKSFVKTCDEEGVDIPHDIFGIYIADYVTIK